MNRNIFSSTELRFAREDAKKAGIKVPKLSTWFMQGVNRYYQVSDDKGNTIWEGRADSSSDAKAKAIGKLVDDSIQLQNLGKFVSAVAGARQNLGPFMRAAADAAERGSK